MKPKKNDIPTRRRSLSKGPLSDLKVIELAAIGPIPMAAMMLADMGAQVVRVDRVRSAGSLPGVQEGFENRGRRSICVDLKSPAGVAVVRKMLETADVLLEGFRPGVLEKLGLGPEVCLATNPRLIVGRMTGWGQQGPLSKVAGHDLNYIAITGALHAMGRKHQSPSPPLNLVGDYGGGAMMLLVGVLASLHERTRSRAGQVVDAAMTDGVAALMSPIYSLMFRGLWSDERGANLLDGGAPFYDVYECSDARFIALGAIEPQFWSLLLQKLGGDPASWPGQLDKSRWPELRQKLTSTFKKKARDEWCALLEGTDVCFAPVLTLMEAANHPHNRARGTFVDFNGMKIPAPAPRFSRTPSEIALGIPKDGEHTLEILAQVGFSPEQVQQLLKSRAVAAAGGGCKDA
jgi:alpha-methylacyl-CoA racemase